MEKRDEKIKVAIVDDHALFRKGLVYLIQELQQIEVVFEAENGEVMKKYIENGLYPEVVLMDIKMPVLDGYQSSRWLRDNHPAIKVLALSMYEDDRAVINMIKSGAGGYVLKSSGPRELLLAINIIHDKGVFLNENMSGKLFRNAVREPEPIFTKNELQFLKLCCSELTYKEIADQLCLSPRTIDNYRDSLFEKLQIKSRTGLVLYAIKNEIVDFGVI
ncbi:response regulator transcription factor [Pedobacter duraquae]|uniref:LuxR family two component transcriptional regulator n=1 Tax=Pedobacter duraquae TaxID=425511 RepID=A0A4V3C3Z4_9SPHI|nr:response regulator transcription factor [Pedobacter duraquae]TDO23878.1 LuxR family two component transcriptional regulator [Pedobacter duraquae]